MTFKSLLSVSSILLILLGLAWVIFPAQMLQAWGSSPVPLSVYISQRYAVMLFGYTFLFWQVRNTRSSEIKRSIIGAASLTSLLLAVMSLYGVISKSINSMGWIPFIIESLLTIGFGYHYLKPNPAVQHSKVSSESHLPLVSGTCF